MKKILKTAAVLVLSVMMALCAGAEAGAPAEPVVLPWVKDAVLALPSSSLASDRADLLPLYDNDNATTTVFETADEGVTLSMTIGKRFRMAAFAIGGCDDTYTAALSASQDGENWKDLPVKGLEKNGYMVYSTKGLGVNYRYYRITLTTEEGALEIGTVAFFARQDALHPMALPAMNGALKAAQ